MYPEKCTKFFVQKIGRLVPRGRIWVALAEGKCNAIDLIGRTLKYVLILHHLGLTENKAINLTIPSPTLVAFTGVTNAQGPLP